MTYSFREALRSLAHDCSAAIESVRQRVLPTPGKRKREEEGGLLLAEYQLPKQRIVESQGAREMGAAPSREPRRTDAAATPLAVAAGRENGAMVPEHERTPAAALRPFSMLPGLSAYDTGGSDGASNLDSGTQQKFSTLASLGQRRLLSRVAGLQQRQGGGGRSRLWQRQYPRWGGGTPAKTFASALDLPPESSPLRLGAGRQAGAGGPPGSSARPAPALSQLGRLAATDRAGAEASAALTLQRMPQAAAEAAPRFAGTRPAQELPLMSLPEAALGGLPLALSGGASPELAVARFELERARERRAAEDARANREALLASCDRLMGDRQAALLARTRAVLREAPAGAADGSAQLSRVMLQLAQREAAALAGGLSEAELLEAQQRRLGDARQLRATAQAAAESAVRPAARPAGPAQPRQAAGDVVDLGSSSDEDESAGDEADTRVGEGSAEDSAEEGDEAELRAALRAVGVSDGWVPAGFRPLSRRQKALYADAMDPEAVAGVELRVHRGTNIGVSRGMLQCLKPRVWLNDEVVNLFLGLLQERDRAWRGSDRFPKCHFFNSFFFNKLCGVEQPHSYRYDQVRRWTRAARLAAGGQASPAVVACDRLVCAVHLPAHWVCAVADLRARELLLLDSMAGPEQSRPAQLMQSFRRYVSDEFRDKLGREVDTSDWPIRYPKVPQQENGSDCGVFALMFAEHASRGAPLTFAQADMPYFRALVTASIMELKAPDPL